MDIWMSLIPGARFLDLFGGSGAVGLEAWSRGVESLVVLDRDREVLLQLERSFRSLELEGCQVVSASLPADLAKPLAALREPFDLIFADPPYAFDDYEDLILEGAPHLAPKGELALEHDARLRLPAICGDLGRIDERRYGDSCLSFYRSRFESQG